MMRCLVLNVSFDLFHIRLADGEASVSGLPLEILVGCSGVGFIHFELPFLTSSTILLRAWFFERPYPVRAAAAPLRSALG